MGVRGENFPLDERQARVVNDRSDDCRDQFHYDPCFFAPSINGKGLFWGNAIQLGWVESAMGIGILFDRELLGIGCDVVS